MSILTACVEVENKNPLILLEWYDKTKKKYEALGKSGFMENSKLHYFPTYKSDKSLIIAQTQTAEVVTFVRPINAAIVATFIILVFGSWLPLFIIPCMLASAEFFISSHFLYYILLMSLKKGGYKDKTKRLNLSKVVGFLVK